VSKTDKIEHDFAEEHVFEGVEGTIVALGAEVFECFEEIGIGGGVIFVLGVKDARLEV
jgi:hypothetical protein